MSERDDAAAVGTADQGADDIAAGRALARLLDIMRRLRAPEGCPWDREQDFASIAPFTIEEAYEVAEAIGQLEGRGSPRALESELGDLLFQVVFHAQMGSERRWFDFASVANAICDKLTQRHPHVFGDAAQKAGYGSTRDLNRAWEEQKARERAASPGAATSELADVPLALPALARAAKLGKRAGRVGFDWPDATGVRAKIDEELAEIDEIPRTGSVRGDDAHLRERRVEELGDLLFATANWARHQDVDPEEALRLANAKFERRFRAMEARARERGVALTSLNADAWDALWTEIKVSEKQRDPDVQ
ncbi:MAG TPA: nucleoside triphosphate pyrophosphohydrolase [Steroidobacteraceae bacterium]|nr:nucleoside triphosphate pyrophosphohydrolase [Steroidobacteraceae bacterium]